MENPELHLGNTKRILEADFVFLYARMPLKDSFDLYVFRNNEYQKSLTLTMKDLMNSRRLVNGNPNQWDTSLFMKLSAILHNEDFYLIEDSRELRIKARGEYLRAKRSNQKILKVGKFKKLLFYRAIIKPLWTPPWILKKRKLQRESECI